jgi:hypothetical protein
LCGIRATTDETPPPVVPILPSGFRCDAHVGHLDQDKTAADDPAGGRGNHRLVQFDAQPRHRLPHIDGEISNVGADRKISFF